MLGETIVPGAVLFELQRPAGFNNPGKVSSLSAREKAILRCLTGGASNKTIARRLDISEATVKVHIKTILRKLRAKTERKRLSGRLRT
ncbi:LuxR C-terminal-related transcriptional regulator [Microvirga makkahensis]|uniref:LuxR C-terminal-related transcriptional regulator n=1 Tax=Microvirga makkahensis TaxID=1128670 RepID=UPI001369BEF0